MIFCKKCNSIQEAAYSAVHCLILLPMRHTSHQTRQNLASVYNGSKVLSFFSVLFFFFVFISDLWTLAFLPPQVRRSSTPLLFPFFFVLIKMPIFADFPKLMGRYAVACHDINHTYASSVDGFDSLSMSSDYFITTKFESREFTHPKMNSVYV
jgi:hypothetical protein